MTLAADAPPMPWWGWIVLILLAAGLLIRSAIKSFRRTVRREVAEFLQSRHPDLEILKRREKSLTYRIGTGLERRIDLADVFRAVARLPQRTPEARAAVYEQFFGPLP